ncbi:unnamed protein product [Arctia plantaginis]|uniref:Uncharacterized protein n=1 Tax=Arctia plantaginis TaxID=874455 RepID=A0A8S0Z5H5_ARCPL|nr:unnamed protein product [Arctia plantaginis]CAB3228196.1 unnamed protein product [Arctia plantaginis]
MVTKLTILMIIAHLHRADNTPLRQFREPKAAHALPLLIPHQPSETSPTHMILTPPRVKKSPNIISIPLSQIIVPNLHVIPLSQSNVHHSSIHTDVKHIITNDNIKIPIISQTVSRTSSNVTHPTPSMLIPYTHNLVPFHDLSVIPLQKSLHTVHKIDPKTGHYRLMENKDENMNEEPVNIVRSIYGGFGTGLYFGGQGAGHGFHIFG